MIGRTAACLLFLVFSLPAVAQPASDQEAQQTRILGLENAWNLAEEGDRSLSREGSKPRPTLLAPRTVTDTWVNLKGTWVLRCQPVDADQPLEKAACTNSTLKQIGGELAMLSMRIAAAADAPLLNTMIHEFAEYERELDMVSIGENDLLRDGCGPSAEFRALIAEWDGHAAGYALFSGFYSTWVGQVGLFLEDLFVPQFRHRGVGKALLARVAQIARSEGCYGLRFEVLTWNQPAIELYTSWGATLLDQRRAVLLTDGALERLAEVAS